MKVYVTREETLSQTSTYAVEVPDGEDVREYVMKLEGRVEMIQQLVAEPEVSQFEYDPVEWCMTNWLVYDQDPSEADGRDPITEWDI